MQMNEIQTAVAKSYDNIDGVVFNRKDLMDRAISLGYSESQAYHIGKGLKKIGRGKYELVADPEGATTPAPAKAMQNVSNVVEVPKSDDTFKNLIPSVDKFYVRWGLFQNVRKIVASGQFFPTFITGLSGNGKTLMVEQACAVEKREMIRIQITPETDEDDLMGGFRLENGNTVFEKGPVIQAMERGAILLIDEIDRGSNRLMAIQGVLEGKPVLIKKTKELVTPAPGFNIIATANTKGQGSDDGRFVAATIIDEAFLERFPVTLDQKYPSSAVETKILKNHLAMYGVEITEDVATMIDELINWVTSIRKVFNEGNGTEMITTRRLCQIAQTYSIIGNKHKAIEYCIARFDEQSREGFKDYFVKIAGAMEADAEENEGDVSDD